jgi:hypothetical protein
VKLLSFAQREEYRFKVTENRVLKGIFGTKGLNNRKMEAVAGRL